MSEPQNKGEYKGEDTSKGTPKHGHRNVDTNGADDRIVVASNHGCSALVAHAAYIGTLHLSPMSFRQLQHPRTGPFLTHSQAPLSEAHT